jgi:hypothetical protein
LFERQPGAAGRAAAEHSRSGRTGGFFGVGAKPTGASRCNTERREDARAGESSQAGESSRRAARDRR